MINLEVELEDVLTSNSCSVIVTSVIKYIAYNSKQIPFSYEAFSRTISFYKEQSKNCKDDSCVRVQTIKEKKAFSFLQKISKIFEMFEFTFKNLECEIWSFSVKEVMLIVGPNLNLPKQVLRIILPTLAIGHSILKHEVRKNLIVVFRKLQESKELNDRLFGTVGPTNMFVLVGMWPNASGPQTAWFQEIDHLTITDNMPQTIIRLVNPTCIENFDELKKIESYTWYRSINIIEGFIDMYIDGISAMNIFKSRNNKS